MSLFPKKSGENTKKYIPPLTPVDVRIGGRSFGGVGFVALLLRSLTSSPALMSVTSYSK